MNLESFPSQKPDQEPAEQPSAWDVQDQLGRELLELEATNAPKAEVDAKADEINRNVASLVKLGEISPEDAWALSAGYNPYFDEFDEPEE